MKSLEAFPKNTGGSKVFDPRSYGLDARQQIAAQSRYSGDVGIEVEVEGTGLPHNGCTAVGRIRWIPHEENSLRAVGGVGSGGAEYVLSEPVAYADVPTAVDNLFSHIQNSGGRIVNSTRCSTHVHLNMQGVKLHQLGSFVALWGTFEDALSLWCGDHRAGNHFALRLSDCHEAVGNWVSGFKQGSFFFDRERRYLALNPACLSTFGSLEVRLLGGIDNRADLTTWISWLKKIKDAALSDRFSNPENLAAAFSGAGSLQFCREILGDETTATLDRVCANAGLSLSKLTVEGFRRVQPIVYSMPWPDVIREATKVYVPNPFEVAKPKKKRSAFADPMDIRFVDEGDDIDFN